MRSNRRPISGTNEKDQPVCGVDSDGRLRVSHLAVGPHLEGDVHGLPLLP